MAGEGRDVYAISAGALHHDGNLGGYLGDADLVAGVDRHLNQPRGLRSRMAGQAINAVVTAAKPYHPSLLEHRHARLAEARLLSPQAGRDGADVGDFTGAE